MIANILAQIYRGIDLETDVILQDDGNGPYIAKWNLSDPQPTIKELEQWGADNQDLILEPIRQSLRTQAEDVFLRLAEIVTGEHITEMTLAEWAKKEEISLSWEQAGKPEPAPDNEYYWAYSEAQGDPIKTPWELLDAQLRNAKAWRGMQIGFSVWRQGFRAQIKAATTEAELEEFRAAIEPQLRGLLGL